MPWPRTVLHVDLDAFFVSCELLRRPQLRGRPVAVAGGEESHPGGHRNPGRAVVSAASYEARPFGVRSALPLARALRLCPELEVLPVDIAYYAEVSKSVFAVFREYTPMVEPGSLDEAYLDVTGSQLIHGDGVTIARRIQGRLLAELGLPASVGVATNKTVAKVGSDLRKPRGLVVVEPGTEGPFLADLPLDRLPGAGPKTVERLRLIGVRRIGELASLDPGRAGGILGQAGRALRERAAGRDPGSVEAPDRAKSVSREQTFERDLVHREDAEARVRLLSFAVARRLRAAGLEARAVTIKIRHADFVTTTRQLTLPSPSATDLEISAAASQLLARAWDATRPVRLLGISAERLAPGGQSELFSGPADRHLELDRALDRLRERFGSHTIERGTGQLGSPEDWNGDDLRELGGRDGGEGAGRIIGTP